MFHASFSFTPGNFSGDMLHLRGIVYLTKTPGLDLEKSFSELFVKGANETPKIKYVIVIVPRCLQELDGRTLLLKTPIFQTDA